MFFVVVNLPFDIYDTDDRLMIVNVHLTLAANDIMVSRPHIYITGKGAFINKRNLNYFRAK